MNEAPTRRQRRGRSAKQAERQERASDELRAVWPGVLGGRFLPLSRAEMDRIHGAVVDLLSTLGISQATSTMAGLVCAEGGRLDDHGRLIYPKDLVERAIAGFRRDLRLYDQDGGELDISGPKVHTSTGGGAPSILDMA